MIIIKPTPNILHIKSDNQYQLASTFMRLQEFYESPDNQIRKKHFSLEFFMDRYADQFKNFTYTTDWSGFNVPGNIVDKFFELFWDDLLDKEYELYTLIHDNLETDNYYLIGTYTNDAVVDHELSHAFYYLDSSFKKEMDILTGKLKAKDKKLMFDVLSKQGYCKEVLKDELQAYLNTSNMLELVDQMEYENLPWDMILKFKQAFEIMIKNNIKEEEDE